MSDTTRWGFSQSFLNEFNAEKASIEQAIASKHDEKRIQDDLAALSKRLNEAHEWLPAYDQRNCQIQVDRLRGLLVETTGSAVKEKKGFAFKRKPKPSTTTTNAEAEITTTTQKTPTTEDTAATKGSSSTNTISNVHNTIVSSSSISANNLDALHIDTVTNSLLLLSSIQHSALLLNIKNSVLLFERGPHQFRLHDSSSVIVVFKGGKTERPTNPVIEGCTDIRFHVYDGDGLDVKDFSFVKEGKSPNWRMTDTSEIALESVGDMSEEEKLTVLRKVLPVPLNT